MQNQHINLHDERGAALMTVILVSMLLGTACIALLASVGASSKNNSDALAESKAYWAAESGLQRTINILRHQKIAYSAAHNSGNMSPWLGGSAPVAVGTEASYTVDVRDPDNTATSTTFSVSGLFEQPNGGYATSRTFTSGAATTTISYEGVTNILVSHPMADGASVSFGRFRIQSTDPAAPIEAVDFKLIFVLAAPTGGSRTIRGSIAANTGTVTFAPTAYELLGSNISICGTMGCPLPLSGLIPATTEAYSGTVNGRMTPIEPYRLLVRATGYGPNSSQKMLEGVIQKNFFNDLGSDNAITFLGRSDCIDFQLGSSAQLDINGGTSPSIGVVSTSSLTAVNTELNMNNTNGTITPAPDLITSGELPDWQQSVQALDSLVRQLRQTAQNSGRYFTNGTVTGGWGDYASGTGITFCEGDCTMSGNTSGGGILVVTGTFTTSGAPSFRGLVLVTGPGGVVRGGGGNENFLGTTVIAPYDPNDLAAGWGCPRYNQNGGAGNTVNVGLSPTLDGTEAISNFMIGVAEK